MCNIWILNLWTYDAAGDSTETKFVKIAPHQIADLLQEAIESNPNGFEYSVNLNGAFKDQALTDDDLPYIWGIIAAILNPNSLEFDYAALKAHCPESYQYKSYIRGYMDLLALLIEWGNQ
jgi:hypothetical protein